MARRGAVRASLGVAAAALALAAALPRAAAVVCVVCPVGFYHTGCDFLTDSPGTCVACANTLPANAAFVAAGAAKNDNSCPWQCLPGYTLTGFGALAGPSCVPSVGGSAGLKAAEATPAAAMGGGIAVPVTIAGGAAAGPAGAAAAAAPMAAAAALKAEAAPLAPATTEPTDVGESSDTANTR